MNRRQLLKSAAPAAGLTILRSGMLRGQTAPSNRLNVALVGVWGRGTAHYASLRHENVVALCDVNEPRMKEALQLFPKAKTHWDWRRLMDQKEADQMMDVLEKELGDETGLNVLLDMSQLQYMNSTGLNILISVLTRTRKGGGEVLISGLSTGVKQLFMVTKLDTVFTIKGTVDEAIASLSS